MKVALLTHEIQNTGRDRIHGGLVALKKVAPKVQVVARHEGVLAAECLDVTRSILQAHPDVNVILCIADDGALGASYGVAVVFISHNMQHVIRVADRVVVLRLGSKAADLDLRKNPQSGTQLVALATPARHVVPACRQLRRRPRAGARPPAARSSPAVRRDGGSRGSRRRRETRGGRCAATRRGPAATAPFPEDETRLAAVADEQEVSQ